MSAKSMNKCTLGTDCSPQTSLSSRSVANMIFLADTGEDINCNNLQFPSNWRNVNKKRFNVINY